MPTIAVIGGQWGDEGKGKIVDFLAQNADIVERAAGGGNAGHSVENEKGKFALRIIPCGMVNSRTRLNIIGPGTVPELNIVIEELTALEDRGLDIIRLRIDEAAHLVMPYHIAKDRLEEERKRKKDNSIGTTGNGIGPCYADKIDRVGFRAGDLLDFSSFRDKFRQRFKQRTAYLKRNYRPHFTHCNSCYICESIRSESTALVQLDDNIAYLRRKFGRLENLICDTQPILWDALARGEKVLLEGAQGYFLDINHGTYPYVTSSSTGVAAAADVCGLALSDITERLAVVKAYCSRVGRGPFPTEMPDYPARRIRDLGHEFGTVTGRPRRIGWYDTVYFKRMARANGLTGVAITRLDILDSFSFIGVGIEGGGGSRDIEWLQGWSSWNNEVSVRSARTWQDLPQAAKDYCVRIACGYPIKYISVGPSREETIVVNG